MAGSPPVDPPETGASGLGGGDVDPEHALIYTGKWPFGDPLNPRPDADSPGVTELHVSPSADGGGSIFDDMFPFKLQFFIDDDPESDTYKERRLRIYTGMLTAMINTFTYSKKKDTDTRYAGDLDVADCTGDVCFESPETEPDLDTGNMLKFPAHPSPFRTSLDNEHNCNHGTITSSQPTTPYDVTTHTHTVVLADSGTDPDHPSHSHSVHSHYHEIPDHSHFTSPDGEDKICELSVTKTRCDVEKFLTIGGQPKIQELTQIEPAGFAALTNHLGQELEYRAQTLDDTYGKVWLSWELDTGGVDGELGDSDVVDVIKDVKITMSPHVEDDPATPLVDESDTDPDNVRAGALTVTNWNATRAPDVGTYYLLIGTTYDTSLEPPAGTAIEDINIKSIVQVIYENVYYSPLILPVEDDPGSPTCDTPVSVDWN